MRANADAPVLDVDVAIIGAGLVGSSLAVALAPLGLRLALVEATPARAEPRCWDERCIAINAASQQLFAQMGVWDAMVADAEPILSTHISERGRFGVARFGAQEVGLPALGYNTPMRTLNTVLDGAAQSVAGLHWLAPARLMSLHHGADAAMLQLQGRDGPIQLRARLVAAADGARSPVRSLLGIASRVRHYGQQAVVSAVRPQRPHRGVAYERFMAGGPLALLPKPDDADGHACSLVWTVPDAQVSEALAQSDADYLAAAQQAFGERLGRFQALGRRRVWRLEQCMAERLSAPRVLLLGNAAQALHPMAAQGFNLGLRDAATLAELLSGHRGDPGEEGLLAAYTERREQDRRQMASFTDSVVRIFSNRLPGWSGLRHLGLLGIDLLPPLHSRLLRQNLGLGAGTPRIASR